MGKIYKLELLQKNFNKICILQQSQFFNLIKKVGM